MMENLTIEPKITSTPAKIEWNHDEVSKQLDGFLKHYESLVIGPDDVKTAKDDMAYLNKVIKEINALKKEKIDAVSAPIIAFGNQVKEFASRIDSVRDLLKKQVEKYESETKAKIKEALEFYLGESLFKSCVLPEFAEVSIDDLVVLGSFTKNEALTKGAKESVDSRVQSCLNKQMKVENRIMQLENASYKAGLKSPLTREHIEGFLRTDDDAYYADRLQALISSELKRQEAIEKSIEDERKAKEESERIEAENKQIEQQAEIELEKNPPAPKCKASPGKVVRIVVARFEVEVPVSATDEQISSKLIKRLNDVGLGDHLHSVEVL